MKSMTEQLFDYARRYKQLRQEMDRLVAQEVQLRKGWSWNNSVAFIKGDRAVSEYGANSEARRQTNQDLTSLKEEIILYLLEQYEKDEPNEALY